MAYTSIFTNCRVLLPCVLLLWISGFWNIAAAADSSTINSTEATKANERSSYYADQLLSRYDKGRSLSISNLTTMLTRIGLEEMTIGDDDPGNRASNSNVNISKCTSAASLLAEFGYSSVPSTGLNHDQLKQICPSLLFRLDSGLCDEYDNNRRRNEKESRNMALIWLYMMLLVTAISLCAVWGILFIPKKSKSAYIRVIQFLMALAAGTMAGDGLLHLLPHAMMPPHDEEDHHDDHHDDDDHEQAHTNALLKGLMALLGVYAFFFLERTFTIIKLRNEKKQRQKASQDENNVQMVSKVPIDDDVVVENDHGHSHSHFIGDILSNSDRHSSKWRCPKLTPLALMILIGDFFHNFCDGLAIGAGFASSTTIGFSTAIAVFTHELPHEIGDFAVLIQSGLTKREAVFLNFLSALSCYLGAVIGIQLGTVGDAPLWIFAGVGGMFLYIALVDLVPEMTQIYVTAGDEWPAFLGLHAAGLFFGAFLMFIIGLYEHDISTALE